MRWSCSIAVWSALALDAASVGAQGNPAAAKLFEEGRAFADQGNYEEACDRYSKSFELERAPGTMLNLGDCAERAGQLRQAWLMYDAAAQEYRKAKKTGGAKFARERADALAPKLATVVVRIAEPRAEGMVVRIGGREVPPAAEITDRLDPGVVQIEVGAPGREPFSKTANVALGEQVVIEVPELRTLDGGVAPRPPPPPPELDRPPEARRQRSRVLIAAGVGGAGAISLGVAGVFAIAARSSYRAYEAKQVELGCLETCTAEGSEILGSYYDRAARRADLATGFVIGGAALIAGGVVLYLTAPRERVTVAPSASATSVELLASIRF